MKLFRLTSVLLCCALLSSFLILPASAVDDDDYYSVPAVSDGSVPSASLGGLVLASATSWDTDDRYTLNGIYKFIQYLTTSPISYNSGSIVGLLHQILDASIPNSGTNFRLIGGNGTNDFLKDLFDKTTNFYDYVSGENIAGNLGNIQRNTLASADRILTTNTALNAIHDRVASEVSLSSFKVLFSAFAPLNQEFPGSPVSFGSYFSKLFAFTANPSHIRSSSEEVSDLTNLGFGYNVYTNMPDGSYAGSWYSFSGILSSLVAGITLPGSHPGISGGQRTLYSRLSQIQEVLASDDDLAMREDQKENVEQVKKDFITGKSGKTSLGKDDFGSLSSVGGTFKDTISLNGQSSLSDLTSGLADADTAGQGWFSQATKDSLDAVSGSTSSESTVSTFSDDGLYSVDVDPDPYHMQGFEENYAWLWGDDDG